ncbi:MAG: hypothetical protein AB7V18_12055 [Pyrinomonadaceae bacterium]
MFSTVTSKVIELLNARKSGKRLRDDSRPQNAGFNSLLQGTRKNQAQLIVPFKKLLTRTGGVARLPMLRKFSHYYFRRFLTVKKNCKVFVGLFLALLGISLLTNELYAQCVQCSPHASGFYCTSAASGGGACKTQDFSCTLIGVCIPNSDVAPTQGGKGTCSLKSTKNPFISVDNSIVKAVGYADARLALAILNVRNIKAEFGEARVTFASVEYDSRDVENQLIQPVDPSYYAELEQRVRAASDKDPVTVTYIVTVGEIQSDTPTLRISPATGNGSSVELRLQRSASAKDQSSGFTAVQYQIK